MTVYYSKIGTLRFKDKTLNLKIDLRARIITLRRLSCPMLDCIKNATKHQISRAHFLRRAGIVYEDADGKGVDDEVVLKDVANLCPNCERPLHITSVQAYKIYANIDRRINMAELWGGPCQLQYKDETAIWRPQPAIGIRLREAKEFFNGRFRQTKREWYHIIYTYNELKRIATTLHVIPFSERGVKKKKQNYTATYAAVPFPPQERFDTEFNDGLARKLGRLI